MSMLIWDKNKKKYVSAKEAGYEETETGYRYIREPKTKVPKADAGKYIRKGKSRRRKKKDKDRKNRSTATRKVGIEHSQFRGFI